MPPIRIAGPIGSEALPTFAFRISGDFIVVSRFPSPRDLGAYLTTVHDGDVPRVGINRVAFVSAKVFKPTPFMPKAALLGSIVHRKPPAFLLLNGITMGYSLS